MLLCVILFWPSKIENLLIEMQNMFEVWEFKDNWLKTLFLRNLDSIQHLISYSCILFIKYYTLGSFCIELLCFSKNYVFQIFYWSNLFLDRSKMRLKFWFEFDRFDCCSIGSGSIEGIFDRSNLIFDQSKIVWRVF